MAYDSERPNIELILPREGKDIQDIPLFWTLPPDGRAFSASIKDFSKVTEFVPPEKGSDEAYEATCFSLWKAFCTAPSTALTNLGKQAIAREMKWDILGVPLSEIDLNELRNDPGTSLAASFWDLKLSVAM